MKNLNVTWKGISPLIMHSCKCVNPLHPIAKEMKKYTSIRKKTDEDYAKIADLEWDAGVYWEDGVGPYVPTENIEACIVEGAKASKKGKDIQKYCNVTGLIVPLDYGANLTKEELIQDWNYRDCRIMTVQRAKINRTRPRFNHWQITFNLMYDETKIDEDVILNAMEYAGAYVGLCDSRPKYGRFTTIVDIVD